MGGGGGGGGGIMHARMVINSMPSCGDHSGCNHYELIPAVTLQLTL